MNIASWVGMDHLFNIHSRTVPTVLVLILCICCGIGEGGAQVTDGQHISMQSLAAAKSATDTGKPVSDTGCVWGTSNSSESNPRTTPTGHRVSLCWNPSVPATDSARDAIIGYIVYRSTKKHDRNPRPVNVTRITGTTFIDSDVKPGKTYYYITRAVSASGKLSDPSNEVSAEIPR